MRTHRSSPKAAPAILAAMVTYAGCTSPNNPEILRTFIGSGVDVLQAGTSVTITDSVPGDVMVAGGTLEFDGVAGGSYLGAGRTVSVAGEVGGSVRAAAFSVDLDAIVARNVTLAGERVTVGESTSIGGNTYLAGNRIRFSGAAVGDVVASGGEVVIAGEIGGDLQIEATGVTIEPDAVIRGEVRYRVRKDAEPAVSPDATVDGGLVPLAAMDEGEGSGLGSLLFKVLAFVLTALVVVVLVPNSATEAAETLMDRPIAALLRGLLWLFLAPVLVIVLAISLVGLPLALILAAAYGALFYLAPIVPALWVGDRLARRPEAKGVSRLILPTAVGATIIVLALLLPWIGFLVRIVLTCAGIGGLALLIGARRRAQAH